MAPPSGSPQPSNGWAAYIVAAAVGAAIAYLEVATHLKSRPTLADRALLWWLPRLGLEALVGITALWFLDRTVHAVWMQSVVGWVAAGLAGSAIVRSQILTFQVGGHDLPIGLASIYDIAREHCHRGLESIGAQGDTHWVQHGVLPALEQAGTTPVAVGELLTSYIKRIQDHEPAALLIVAIVDDPKKTDRDKLKELIDYTCCELGAFRLVQQLYDDARSPRHRRKSTPRH